MSQQMDPDGLNRIVQQRISVWNHERDHDRHARLLDTPGRRRLPDFSAMAEWAVAHSRILITLIRRGIGPTPSVEPLLHVVAIPDPAEGGPPR